MTTATLNTPTEKQIEIHDKVFEVIKEHHNDVTSIEMIAIMSNIVGKLIALQEQVTAPVAYETINHNIKLGLTEGIVALAEAERKADEDEQASADAS